MFDSLSAKFGSVLAGLRKQGKISAASLDASMQDLRTSLLDSDVAVSVVDQFISRIASRLEPELDRINKSINPAQATFNIINEELVAILSQTRDGEEGNAGHRIRFAKKPPTIIMLVGLQGAGKTTLAGKLALKLKSEGNTPLLVAADLQRPSAVEQLKVIGEQVKVPVFAPHQGNVAGDVSGDPVRVANDAIKFAQDKLHNLVIIDTAGRLGVDQELLNQARAIKDAVNPDEVFFVVDAMIGQDAVVTAKSFGDAVGFDGVILTKLDGDARGGAALSIATITGKPILFASLGEKLDEFDYFYPERIASRILGMGDLATLSEKAKAVVDEKKAAEIENKILSGQGFTLDDFLEQLEALSKMGNLTSILSALPGANSGAMKKQMESLDGGELTRTKAIIQSMTPSERNNPAILNGSRRARIAAGSGRAVSEINRLVDRFTQAQKMMKQMAPSMGKNGKGGKGLGRLAAMAGMRGALGQGVGGMGGLPNLGGGIPNLPATPKGNSNTPPKKKSKSGNPAKRAQAGN